MDIIKTVTRITTRPRTVIRYMVDSIRASDIQRYVLGLRSAKWYLCELQSVYMMLCYSLGASCVGGLDLIYISYTLFTGGLYVKFFFGIWTFWAITA